ncbi:response regulator [Achromobacter sp. UBA2119]|uniref:response regulator n=1 Tax=Achromobacter sp. UBA2119 TaxID=1945911 RepID=UPI00257F112A|nr:response regulator [Achromobacter sp. UBA2119]
MTKALLVEDDAKLARLIAQFLEQHGFNVVQAYRGDHAVDAFRRHEPAITILDLMLPGRDGLQVCRDLRAFSSAPILMLTAREDDVDQILGLESGADDYVIKPVEPRVLLARIRALMRRHNQAELQPELLVFGPLSIDRQTRAVVLAGAEVDLTTLEFEMLWALASQAGPRLPWGSLAEMRKLAASVSRRLDMLRAPCLVIHARQDDVAPVSNAFKILKGARNTNVQLQLLTDRRHVVTMGRGCGDVVSRVAAFVSNTSLNPSPPAKPSATLR